MKTLVLALTLAAAAGFAQDRPHVRPGPGINYHTVVSGIDVYASSITIAEPQLPGMGEVSHRLTMSFGSTATTDQDILVTTMVLLADGQHYQFRDIVHVPAANENGPQYVAVRTDLGDRVPVGIFYVKIGAIE